MRIVTILFISLFVCQINIEPVFSNDNNFYELLSVKAKKLHLYGKLATGTVRSESNNQPLLVIQNSHNIEVYFQSSLGSLNIYVVNRYGYPVFQRSVNAVSGSTFSISTKGWGWGYYTIHIEDSHNGCLHGDFEIER